MQSDFYEFMGFGKKAAAHREEKKEIKLEKKSAKVNIKNSKATAKTIKANAKQTRATASLNNGGVSGALQTIGGAFFGDKLPDASAATDYATAPGPAGVEINSPEEQQRLKEVGEKKEKDDDSKMLMYGGFALGAIFLIIVAMKMMK
jgi:hypothetical protein